MNRRYLKFFFFFLSFLAHAILVCVLLSGSDQNKNISSRWRGGEAIWVSVSELSSETGMESDGQSATATNLLQTQKSNPKSKPQNTNQSPKTPNFANANLGPNGSGLDADGSTSPSTLAEIRARIDRHKFMPLIAQEQNLSGTVKLTFQIDAQGQVVALEILKSSGHAVLDQAALNTVQKATPLPLYKNPIAIELEYQ